MEIDWKRKLTSRKFWLAVIGLVSGLMLLFKVDGETVDKIAGLIMEAASVIAYLISEGMTDAAGVEAMGKHKAVNVVPLYGGYVEDKDE